MNLPVHIIIGSEQGNTEALALEVEDLINDHFEFDVISHEQPQYHDIPQQDCIWLVVTATFGAGDYPANIQSFVDDLNQNKPNLTTVNYAVIAVGDKNYDTFCQAGHNIDDLLSNLGGNKQVDRLEICVQECDDPSLIAFEWLQNWL